MSDRIERLCGQAKQGDAQAASELVEFFYERIFAYFRRLCGNDPDAADLTQKTFVKAWGALASYEARSAFPTWLHGIAHHVYVDWRRRPNRTEVQTEDWWLNQEAPGASPFEDAAERDTAHALYRAVEALEEPARETIHLHYYHGLSLGETAEALGVAVSTVKYRVQQAVVFLRKQVSLPSILKECSGGGKSAGPEPRRDSAKVR